MRTGSAIYQTFYGHLALPCLEVMDGKLLQTPFKPACMKPVNYPILALNFLPLSILPGTIIYNNIYNAHLPRGFASHFSESSDTTVGIAT